MRGREHWLEPVEFEDAVAACNLLPGPASTQLSIFCAMRVRGRAGAIVGGLAFIIPGLILILVLSALFLGSAPPRWIEAAGAGSGAAVAAVAVHAALGLLPTSWRRATHSRTRWSPISPPDCVSAATLGPWLVLVLLGCGAIELTVRTDGCAAARSAPAPRAVGLRRRQPWHDRVADLGRVQGRSAVLRRRVRDHPADAVRRRQPLPLADQHPVPLRSRTRPSHPGTCRADRVCGRLRRCRRPRRRSGRDRCVLPVVRVHPARSQPVRPASPRPPSPSVPRRRRTSCHRSDPRGGVALARALSEPWQYAILAGASVRSS